MKNYWTTGGAAVGMLAPSPSCLSWRRQDTSSARQDTSFSQRSDTSNSQMQNAPGYRGMERPANLPADSGAVSDSSAPADATSRIHQRPRRDSMGQPGQNPPGYRGLERPATSDSAAAQAGDAGKQAWSSKKASGRKSHTMKSGAHKGSRNGAIRWTAPPRTRTTGIPGHGAASCPGQQRRRQAK
jgi:hypothetical protein